MMKSGLLAIELNDAKVLTLDAKGVCTSSPGYALLSESEIRFGAAAKSLARRHPRRVESQFWDGVSNDSLQRSHPLAEDQSDLAHGHLRSVLKAHLEQGGAEPGEIILAVPGSFDASQLGRLLGITDFLEWPVVGWVDLALAAGRGAWGRGESSARRVHVDLLLNRAVLTHLRSDGQDVIRSQVETSALIGAALLETILAKRLSELFLRRTRFDPLHDASSEQRLYDLLPVCLEALRTHESVTLELEAGGRTHQIIAERSDLAVVIEPVVEKLLRQLSAFPDSGPPPHLLFAASWEGLPGIETTLKRFTDQGSFASFVFLEPGAAARSILADPDTLRNAERRPGMPLEWVTCLPAVSAGASRDSSHGP